MLHVTCKMSTPFVVVLKVGRLRKIISLNYNCLSNVLFVLEKDLALTGLGGVLAHFFPNKDNGLGGVLANFFPNKDTNNYILQRNDPTYV